MQTDPVELPAATSGAWGPLRTLLGLILGAVGGLTLLQLLQNSAANLPWNPDAANLTAWFKIKREVAASTPSPRLLLMGGSNVFYGLRAEQLQREFGVPVANLGTHAALPAAFHFWEIERWAQAGDVVLYLPEYDYYLRDPAEPNIAVTTYLVSQEPSFLRSLDGRNRLRTLLTLPPENLLARWLKNANQTETIRTQFEAGNRPRISTFGDMLLTSVDLQSARQREMVEARSPTNLRQVAGSLGTRDFRSLGFFRSLLQFHRALQARGATLLFSWPNTVDIPSNHAPEVHAMFTRLRGFLEAEGIPVIGDPYASMLPRSEFFDTVYHLHAEGAQRRTARLAPLLREALDQRALLPPAAPSPR